MGTWADVRRRKVPADQEASARATLQALEDAVALSELRAAQGLTQVEVARRLGVRQGSVSELERREDVYLSTLREYVEALGGRLEVAAVFDGERVPVSVGGR